MAKLEVFCVLDGALVLTLFGVNFNRITRTRCCREARFVYKQTESEIWHAHSHTAFSAVESASHLDDSNGGKLKLLPRRSLLGTAIYNRTR